MKARITLIVLALIFLISNASAQFTSLPIRLVTATGTPMTGRAGEIEFTKYPHNYPADIVASITVTEIGTAGNYIAKGFTSFQFVKLWLDGTNQQWFDSVLTGNIFSYLSGNYVTLGTNQTITGQKTTTGNWSGTMGNWDYTGTGLHIFNKPYISGTSPWISDYSQITGTSLLPRIAADSLYLKREFVYYISGDNKLYFNTPGSLGTYRIAKRGNGQLFDFNSDQFSWSTSTGLNLNTALLNQDSISAKNFTGIKDSTWFVLGEPVSKYRFLTIKKPFWHNPLPFPDWKWYYKSVDETAAILARDSFYVMNHSETVTDDTPELFFADGSWNNCDTITLPARGQYIITYDLSLIFPFSEVIGIAARDSVLIRVVNELNVDKQGSHSEVWQEFNDAISYFPESHTLSRTFSLFNPTAGEKYFLQLKGLIHTELVSAAVTKPQMTYLLVR
ncbi:MAG: hypothetical protein K8I03_14580 [Ignavibacteria bacterium]|nr:hypothetical protein [Ignavibacteria bacterium]